MVTAYCGGTAYLVVSQLIMEPLRLISIGGLLQMFCGNGNLHNNRVLTDERRASGFNTV